MNVFLNCTIIANSLAWLHPSQTPGISVETAVIIINMTTPPSTPERTLCEGESREGETLSQPSQTHLHLAYLYSSPRRSALAPSLSLSVSRNKPKGGTLHAVGPCWPVSGSLCEPRCSVEFRRLRERLERWLCAGGVS